MTKKYILKPGRHQFAPGSHAVHENESLSDGEAEWYLERYPHITALFDKMPGDTEQPTDSDKTACRVSVVETKTSSDKIGAILPISVEFQKEISVISNPSVESKEI